MKCVFYSYSSAICLEAFLACLNGGDLLQSLKISGGHIPCCCNRKRYCFNKFEEFNLLIHENIKRLKRNEVM